MNRRLAENERFLRSIYRGGTDRPAFCCLLPHTPIYAVPGGPFNLSTAPVREWVGWVAEDYRRQVELVEAIGHDGVPTARLLTGTEIFAQAFGCPVHQYEDSNPCALPRVANAAEADAIALPSLWDCPGLVRVFELGKAVQAELGLEAVLGPCDMQTGFDIAAQIWEKTDFLCALATPGERDAVKRLVGICAEFYRNFLAELRREFPTMSPCHCPSAWAPPELGPWTSNDECGILSTEMFEEFALPELIELSRTFGSLGMHCCAAAEHQFPSFNKIPNFYAFNRVPAKQGIDPILEHFGGPEGPVHVLAWLSDATIERLLRTAPPGTRFIFVRFSPDHDDAARWLDRMRQLV